MEGLAVARGMVKNKMKHLIIYVNPEKESFSHDIKEYVVNFSNQKGYEVEIRDLYKIGFNPILSIEDLELEKEDKVVEEVKKEQDYINWSDAITLIYPIWWQIPAMMKGYFDRVFSYGYAYRMENGKPKGLLPRKKVLRYNPMGSPRELYEKNGLRKTYEKAIDIAILQSSGLKVVDSILFGSNPRYNDALKEKYLDELKESLETHLN